MIRVLIGILTAAYLLTAPAAVLAQNQPDSALVRVLTSARARDLYVRLTAPTPASGRITNLTDIEVRLPGRRINLADLTAVDYRHTRGGGALVGAVAGTVVVGGFFYGASAVYAGEGAGIAAGSFLLGALVGGPIGAIAGRLLHPPTVTWQAAWHRD